MIKIPCFGELGKLGQCKLWSVIGHEDFGAAITCKMWLQFLNNCHSCGGAELVYFPVVAKVINSDHVILAFAFEEIYGDLLPWTGR